MKLWYCPKCHDIRAMTRTPTTCCCGQSGGHYISSNTAVIYDATIAIGITNTSLRKGMIAHQLGLNLGAKGLPLTAFLIPEDCTSVSSIDKPANL